MKIGEIHVRDPFVMTAEGKYFLYGTRGREAWSDAASGLDVFVSEDLERWEGPTEVFTPPEGFWATRDFWAPEVHAYRGAYYMLVSFKSATERRGTQILRAESPMGPFLPHSDGPVTPRDWECLDGTLYIDKGGAPWMVFCHEWVQVKDGEMCAMPLTADLRAAAGAPEVLFHASEPAWARKGQEDFVTDGPFLYRTAGGRLLMIWSSFSDNGYVQAVAASQSGEITGPWRHEPLLFDRDGGHGMIFRTLTGKLYLVIHSPNEWPRERPLLLPLREENACLVVDGQDETN